MDEPTTYLGVCATHLHCENYKFRPDTPLKIFQKDEICNELTWIDITDCSGTLDETTFKNLPNLEVISLDKCNIDKIHEDTFSSLPHLKSVDVRKSTFPLDQHTFKNCANMDNLRFIQTENIISYSHVFEDLKNLEYLMIDHLTGLQLTENLFSGLGKLKYLILQNCSVGEFSENAFDPLENLETFYFTGNTLEHFNAKAFLSLKNLSIFGLYGNVTPTADNLQIDYQMFEALTNLDTVNFPEEIIRTLQFESFKNLKNVQLVIGKCKDDIIDFLDNKNINIQWTTDNDLTEEIDFSDPDMQVCG